MTRSQSAKPCTTRDTSPANVCDDISIDEESFTVAIIGGGPHALAALAALHDGPSAFEKVGTVCVIDPNSHFMESWNSRFDALEITHLRSPAFAHSVAFEPTALLDFAAREGRLSELGWLDARDVVVKPGGGWENTGRFLCQQDAKPGDADVRQSSRDAPLAGDAAPPASVDDVAAALSGLDVDEASDEWAGVSRC